VIEKVILEVLVVSVVVVVVKVKHVVVVGQPSFLLIVASNQVDQVKCVTKGRAAWGEAVAGGIRWIAPDRKQRR
jgi:hypothetical protein